MNIANAVTAISNPFFSVPEKYQYIPESEKEKAVEFALRNKALPMFYEGCKKLGINLPPSAEDLNATYIRRKQARLEAAQLLARIQKQHGIKLMFFKTFKPFNYIPDDVDILVNEDSLSGLVELLKPENYFILKIGTPEVTLRKVGNGTYVDLDVHKHLAVGYLDLFDVEKLWRKHAYETVIIGGYPALKLSEDYEVVREAAYSQLKDLHISISGLYLGINALKNRDLKKIEEIADQENFSLHLNLYLYLVYRIACKLFGKEAQETLHYQPKLQTTRLMKFCKNLQAPYKYPIPIITTAYLARAYMEIDKNKNLAVVPQIIKQPTSKGVSVLLNYINGHS